MASAETANTTPTHSGADIADPGPLGLTAFAATTLVLSLTNAGVADAATIFAVVPLAFFFGGLTQLIAGQWEFRKGNTFGATAFSTYGAFWIAFAFYVLMFDVTKKATATSTGMFLLAFTIITVYLTLAALRTNGALIAVFVVLLLTFVILTIGAFAGSDGLNKFGGWLGVITAILAFYTAAAGVVNATWKRTVLPVFPLAGN